MATLTQVAGQASDAGQGSFGNLTFDEYGFLTTPEFWSESVAAQIAEFDGIGPLNTEHWQLINFLRDRYLQLGAIPPLRNLCRAAGLSRERVKALFGSCRTIWRIAGLPDSGEEIRNHMM